MASIRIRNGRWVAQIRRTNFKSQSKSFDDKKEAEAWAFQVENLIDFQIKQDLIPLAPPTSKSFRSKDEIYALPRLHRGGCMGVYFLFLDGECVYVGQSVMIHGRVDKHLKRVPFDSYSWIAIKGWDVTEVERYYIKLLSPKYNVAHKL